MLWRCGRGWNRAARGRTSGAIVGGVIGAVFGKPWWGPPRTRTACWVDYNFQRHCANADLHRSSDIDRR